MSRAIQSHPVSLSDHHCDWHSSRSSRLLAQERLSRTKRGRHSLTSRQRCSALASKCCAQSSRAHNIVAGPRGGVAEVPIALGRGSVSHKCCAQPVARAVVPMPYYRHVLSASGYHRLLADERTSGTKPEWAQRIALRITYQYAMSSQHCTTI